MKTHDFGAGKARSGCGIGHARNCRGLSIGSETVLFQTRIAMRGLHRSSENSKHFLPFSQDSCIFHFLSEK